MMSQYRVVNIRSKKKSFSIETKNVYDFPQKVRMP